MVPVNVFAEAASAAPIKFFVGEASVISRPYNLFSCQKISNSNSQFQM